MHTQLTPETFVDIFKGDDPLADARLSNGLMSLRAATTACCGCALSELGGDGEWSDRVLVDEGLLAAFNALRSDDVSVMLYAGMLQECTDISIDKQAHVRAALLAILTRPAADQPFAKFPDEAYAALMASKTWCLPIVCNLLPSIEGRDKPVNPGFDEDAIIAAGEAAGIAAATRDRELFVARKKLEASIPILHEARLLALSPDLAAAAAVDFTVDPVRVAIYEHWNGPSSPDMFHHELKLAEVATVKAVFRYLFSTVNPFAPDAASRGEYLASLIERLTDKCRHPSASRHLLMDAGVLKLIVESQMMLPRMAEFLRTHIMAVIPVDDKDDAAYQTKAFLASGVVALTARSPDTLDAHVVKHVKSPTLALYLINALCTARSVGTLPKAITADALVPLVHLIATVGDGAFGCAGGDFFVFVQDEERAGVEPSAAVRAAIDLLPVDLD